MFQNVIRPSIRIPEPLPNRILYLQPLKWTTRAAADSFRHLTHLLPIELRHGGEGRYFHRADILAGEGLGTVPAKMRRVHSPDLLRLCTVAGSDEVTVISEGRPIEGMAVDVVRADLQAEAAL